VAVKKFFKHKYSDLRPEGNEGERYVEKEDEGDGDEAAESEGNAHGDEGV
jgi:hypothetical protein